MPSAGIFDKAPKQDFPLFVPLRNLESRAFAIHHVRPAVIHRALFRSVGAAVVALVAPMEWAATAPDEGFQPM